jgi:hypothetical protein
MSHIGRVTSGSIPARWHALDSLCACRYAEAMRILRMLLVLTCFAISATAGSVVHSDDAPVLALLEYSGGLLPKRAEIRAQTGVVTSPYTQISRSVWTLREGDTIRQDQTPASRFIRLVYLSGNTPLVLCNIVVRYTPSEKGWRPSYLLLQLSPSIWDGDKFVPRPGMGTREPVQIVNPIDPAGDGFYHSLSFGLGSGTTQITAWEVQ